MRHVVSGVFRFQTEIFPARRQFFATLAKGQQPTVLFITCTDSRFDANLVTQTAPGELFICRNAGNIVPPHSAHGGGTMASIEFAVGVLGVKDIIICGHTDCGVMRGACNPDALGDLPHVKSWLGQARAAMEIVKARWGFVGDEHLDEMTEQNVLVQLQHLRTHPPVAARLATDQIALHGWLYDIETGHVRSYDERTKRFVPLEERYADILREVLEAKQAGDAKG